MNRYLVRIVLIGCILFFLSMGVAPAVDQNVVEIIRSKTEQIKATGSIQIEGAQIASVTVLPELYEKNGFQPLWTDPQNVDELFNAVKNIENDGLQPNDYHYIQIGLKN